MKVHFPLWYTRVPLPLWSHAVAELGVEGTDFTECMQRAKPKWHPQYIVTRSQCATDSLIKSF